MVQSLGSPMSLSIALQFSILCFFNLVLFSFWLVSLFLSGLVMPVFAWKSPKNSLVLELGSDII